MSKRKAAPAVKRVPPQAKRQGGVANRRTHVHVRPQLLLCITLEARNGGPANSLAYYTYSEFCDLLDKEAGSELADTNLLTMLDAWLDRAMLGDILEFQTRRTLVAFSLDPPQTPPAKRYVLESKRTTLYTLSERTAK